MSTPDMDADPASAEPEQAGRFLRWWRAYLASIERRPFMAAWQGVAAATLVITVVGGMLVRLTDPESIDSLAQGMWWDVTAFAVAVGLVAGPWYMKNAIVTGNPTYPLLVSVFGGNTRTEAKDQQWRVAHRERDAQGKTYTLPLLVRGLSRIAWRSEWLNPLLAPLALVGFVLHRRNRSVWLIGGCVVWIIAVWWLAGHRIDRFWLPAMPLLAMLAGMAVGTLPTNAQLWRRVVLALAGLALLIGGLAGTTASVGDVRIFVPLADLRRQGQHPLHQELDRRVPEGWRALLVGDAQPFDLNCAVDYSTCFDDTPLEPLVASRSTEERRTAFTAARISHVLVQWNEIARYRQPGNYGFPEFVTRELFDELCREPAVLRRLPVDPRLGELYEVIPAP